MDQMILELFHDADYSLKLKVYRKGEDPGLLPAGVTPSTLPCPHIPSEPGAAPQPPSRPLSGALPASPHAPPRPPGAGRGGPRTAL